MEFLLTSKKALDTVDHSILLRKLSHCGIRGVANKTSIKHGVPQGSVLGPLLSLIYINDFHVPIFPDDTTLLLCQKSAKKLNENRSKYIAMLYINHDLKLMCHWLRGNKISLQAGKTELVIFKSPNKIITKHLTFVHNFYNKKLPTVFDDKRLLEFSYSQFRTSLHKHYLDSYA